jgi:hypothetical protein
MYNIREKIVYSRITAKKEPEWSRLIMFFLTLLRYNYEPEQLGGWPEEVSSNYHHSIG